MNSLHMVDVWYNDYYSPGSVNPQISGSGKTKRRKSLVDIKAAIKVKVFTSNPA